MRRRSISDDGFRLLGPDAGASDYIIEGPLMIILRRFRRYAYSGQAAITLHYQLH